MTRFRVLAAGCAAGLAVAITPVAAAATAPSKATNWQTSSTKVECGIARIRGTAIDPAMGMPMNGLWPGLQCSAPGIRRAPGGGDAGDPFVTLGQGKAGRGKVVNLSQNDLIYHNKLVTLASGSSWSRYGITCSVKANSIACQNASGHGFTLAPGQVKVH